jgi:succinate dehydrogenase / fumarate reductase cytochrome b subunit
VPLSAAAVHSTFDRSARFYGTTIGKKAVMAVTGVILFGFLVAHMAGNLQFFAGPEKLNAYAEDLRKLGPLLWVLRIGLLVAAILHITASVQLARLKLSARPISYAKKQSVGSTYASRTMYWSGPIVLAFLVYHLMHLTFGVGGLPFQELKPYDNVVAGFSNPFVSLAYAIAMVLLGIHLYHGLWSMFQSLGIAHPRYTPKLKLLAKTFTVVLVLGFLSVPLAILAGYRPAGPML